MSQSFQRQPGTNNLSFYHSRCPLHGSTSVAVTQSVHSFVQVHALRGILEHVQLLDTLYQVTETHTNKPYKHSPLVEPVKEFFGDGEQLMVKSRIGNTFLQGMRVEVRIADLYGYTGSKPLFLPQFEGQLFNHADQQFFHLQHIDGIPVKRMFGTYGFSFGIGSHRCVIDPVGLFPDYDAVLSQHFLNHFGRYPAQCTDGGYSHGTKQVIGLFPDHGDLADRQGMQERGHGEQRDFLFSVGLGFAGGNL